MLERAVRVGRALSVDVALGSACGVALAASVTGASLPGAVWALVPGAVWVVYTLDHVLDARRLGRSALSFRHRFHARHARPLGWTAAAVAAGGLAAALACLPGRLVVAGLGVGAAAALHLGLAQHLGFAEAVPKEVTAAAVYTAGVWCAPLAQAPSLPAWTWPALALFAAAVLGNLLLNALFELPVDAAERTPSWARTFGEEATARLIDGLALGAIVAGAAVAIATRLRGHGAFVVLAVLGAVPAALVRLRRHMATGERYRAYGDLAFFLAALPAVLR